MADLFENLTLDEERALYGLDGAVIRNCRFAGASDGESALKECHDIKVENCDFELRYPMWHVEKGVLSDSKMSVTCRAAMWYDKNLIITNTDIGGVKALRECSDVTITGGRAESTEFGWMCNDICIDNFELISEYPFFHSSDMAINNFRLKGKYSFQYAKNVEIKNSVLDTKDAFWHTEDVTVYDSVIKGEYLAWYSKNLRLVRCKIIGTQPLCYCEGLVLEDCEMENTDLSFENSDVKATVKGNIISVKNPVSGYIHADTIGEIILDEHIRKGANCDIITKE